MSEKIQKIIIGTIVTVSALALATFTFAAYSGPPGNPPDCPQNQSPAIPGCDPSINISGDAQLKAGELQMGSRLRFVRSGAGAGAVSANTSVFGFLRENGTWGLVVNDATGNVGIGTSTPSKLAHIESTNGGPLMLARRGSNVNTDDLLGEVMFDSTDNNARISTIDASALIRGYASENHSSNDKGGYLTFWTKPTDLNEDQSAIERMRITESGSVGIGDTSPSELFVVGSGDLFRVDSSGRAFLPSGASGGGNLALSFTGDTNTGLYRNASDEIRIQTGGSDRVTVNSSGNVGIGTASPGAKLEVAGQIKITGGSPGANKILTSDAAGLASWVAPAVAATPNLQQVTDVGATTNRIVSIQAAGTNPAWTSLNVDSLSAGTTGGRKVVAHANDTDNRASVFAYNYNLGSGIDLVLGGATNFSAYGNVVIPGNVGIGTAGPGAKLHVLGISEWSGTIRADGPANGYSSFGLYENNTFKASMYWYPAMPGVSFYGPSNWLFETGNVGIGATSPGDKLHVTGNIKATGSVCNGLGQCIEPAAGDNLGDHTATQNIQLGSNWLSSDGGAEGIRIDTLGNVGIGTASSNYRFEVSGGNTFIGQYLHIGSWPGYAAGFARFWYDGNTKTLYEDNGSNLVMSGTINAGAGLYDQGVRVCRSDGLNCLASVGDNLGNHTATEALTMAGNDINGASNVRSNDFYANAWFRNNNANQGLYNQATDGYFYSLGWYWRMKSTYGLIFENAYNGTINGYIQHDGTSFGLLSSDGNWRVRTYNGGQALHGATTLERIDFPGSISFGQNTTDDGSYEWVGWNSGASRAGIFLWDGVWSGCDGGKFCIFGDTHQLMLGSNTGNVYVNDGLDVSGNVTAPAFLYSSDRTLKKNIRPISHPLQKILSLDGVAFEWKKDNTTSLGLIAQDVEEVLPEVVTTNDESGEKYINYGALVAPLIEAVKEQQREIDDLKAEVATLRAARD